MFSDFVQSRTIRGSKMMFREGQNILYALVVPLHLMHGRHVIGGEALGGKTCLYNHFGRAKALFYYVNLQVDNSVGGGRIMQ